MATTQFATYNTQKDIETLDWVRRVNKELLTQNCDTIKERCSMLRSSVALTKATRYPNEKEYVSFINRFIDINKSYDTFTSEADTVNLEFRLHAFNLVRELKSEVQKTGVYLVNELSGCLDGKHIAKVNALLKLL